MAPKTKHSEQNDVPPQGINEQDWKKTPDSVRVFVFFLLGKRREKPENRLPLLVVLSLNLVIVLILTYWINKNFALPCVTPHIANSFCIAVILLIGAHLFGRIVNRLIPSNHNRIIIKFAGLELSIRDLVEISNEIQIWKLSSAFLGGSFFFLLIIGWFLNFTPYSPFHKGGNLLAIPSFTVQRLNSPSPEQIPPGGTLLIDANEKVFIKLALLGEAQVSCTWFTTSNSGSVGEDCSILLNIPSFIKRDVLTVFMQPVCGSRQESASLNVIVQP